MLHRPVITLTTDFGLQDHFVGTIKGVILGIAPDAQIVDISHSVPAFDILAGALTLAQAYEYFPADTVHVVVVDPGVGGARRAIVATAGRYRFVAPDNGVLSSVLERETASQVRHITANHYLAQPVSQTFHARDVFAPIAGYLVRGVDPAQLGPEISDYVRLEIPRPEMPADKAWRGQILYVDTFGNLMTNITAGDIPGLFQLPAPPFVLKIGPVEVTRLRSAYSEGSPGEIFLIAGSSGYLELAANQASAARILNAGKDTGFTLRLQRG